MNLGFVPIHLSIDRCPSFLPEEGHRRLKASLRIAHIPQPFPPIRGKGIPTVD